MDKCIYEPTEMLSYFDDAGMEHETNAPYYECGSFACSVCGYEMCFGDGGWFDDKSPYKPLFNYCPNCGRKVEPMKLYDKVVD